MGTIGSTATLEFHPRAAKLPHGLAGLMHASLGRWLLTREHVGM